MCILVWRGLQKVIIRLSWNCQSAKELYILSTLLGQRAARYPHSDSTLPCAAARKKSGALFPPAAVL